MSRRKLKRALIPALALVVAAAVAVPALGQPGASARVSLTTTGAVTFKANRYIKDGMRFNKDSVTVSRGDRIVLRDRTKQPHTLSIVRKGQVPQKLRQIDSCFEGGPCGELFVKHGAVNPDTGEEQEPTNPLVNAGKAGFNQPGDSVLIPPGGRTSVPVTGSKDMFYICAVHPWMQGKVNVR